MANDQIFVDPLRELMAAHETAMGITHDEPADATIQSVHDDEPVDIVENNDDDEYGVNDLANEIAEEDRIAEEYRIRYQQALRKQAEANKPNDMPPRSLDPEFQKESIEFQTSNLQIVSNMVAKVAEEYNLTSGGIPESTDTDPNFKMHVMGDLIEQYHLNGEELTDEFVKIVMNAWRLDPKDAESRSVESDDASEEENNVATPVEPAVPEINITVEKGTPVTVNVDESLTKTLQTSNQVNIHVIQTTVEDMRASNIVNNSDAPNIITPYESEMFDVPLTLPLSGYRCVLRPANYWEFIQLASPGSGNRLDTDKKQWSIIWKHVKNASIGDFTDFEDFLKKTKYADRELMMWGFLVASADDEETITIQCNNPKCKALHTIKYRPTSIIHVNDALMNTFEYKTTHDVAPGEAAIKHFNKINSTVKMYELPHTKLLVEIDTRPSAYDFLNNRYPILDALHDRFYDPEDPDGLSENTEYSYLMAHAMFVTAISKVVGDKTYRYTNWDDIERIITKSLDMRDSAILLQLVQKLATETSSPVQFYLENIDCSSCGRHDDRIIIPDIGQNLIFQLSQRLTSTEIKLTEMERN